MQITGRLRGALTLLICSALPTTALSAGLDSRVAIERAVRHIELGDWALARSYLQRPLIDPRITTTERSRAYYLEGYALEQAGHSVSAAHSYAQALGFNADNPATLAALGNLYAQGLGVAKDAEQAEALLRRSAALGHAPGMSYLGALLVTRAVAQDSPDARDALIDDARAWLNTASEAGESNATLFLAQSYRAGFSSQPDPERALALYKEALVLNEPAAFNSIGTMHLRGELKDANPAAAVAAFTRGAEANSSAAQLSLGYLYLTGNQVAQDLKKARALLEAASRNESSAYFYLGYLAEISEPDGANDTPNPGTRHYQLAAAAGHLPALKRLSEIAFLADQPATGVRYLRDFVSAAERQRGQALSKAFYTARHALAWHLATHQDDAVRDGGNALRYALASVAHERSAATLDTLAAAYAEIEDFNSAIETQQQAIELLPAAAIPSSGVSAGPPGDTATESQLDDYTRRLKAYEAAMPWRESRN